VRRSWVSCIVTSLEHRVQASPRGAACLPATDGALIERRREEIEGSVPVLELSSETRFSRSPPLEAFLPARASNRILHCDVKMKIIPRGRPEMSCLIRIVPSADKSCPDDPIELRPRFTSSEIFSVGAG
jgi:hypothetical protein